MPVCAAWAEGSWASDGQETDRRRRHTLAASLGQSYTSRLSKWISLSKRQCVGTLACGWDLLAVCLLQVVSVMKRDAGSGLEAYLLSDLSSLCLNHPGKGWLLLWELLGDQCLVEDSADGVAIYNNLCSSNFQQILQCFCCVRVDTEVWIKCCDFGSHLKSCKTRLTFTPQGGEIATSFLSTIN